MGGVMHRVTDAAATAHRWAAAALAWDLPTCSPIAPSEPLSAEEWHACLALLRAQRGEGPLAWAIEAGWWPATDAQRDAVRLAHRGLMALSLVLERELLAFDDACGPTGIEFRVLKGTAVAHLDERDPSSRGFGDLDLLVRGEDLERIGALLEADGGTRRYPEARAGFDRRFSKGVSYAFDRNVEIDLHRTLASGAYGLSIDLDELFAATEPFVVGDRKLLALDRSSRFVHAAYHGLLGGRTIRLTALRDLVNTAPVDEAATRTVLDRARRWQGEGVLARAIEVARAELCWRPPLLIGAWAAGYEPTRRDRRWLAAYEGGDRSYAAQMLVGLEALPGVRERVAYAVANATSPVGGSPPTHRWRRGMRALRQSVRR